MVRGRTYPAEKQGFTLIELLVVVSIIGTMTALLLPAVQSAREAARRVHCANNLKQIGFGVLHHEQALGHFPYGGWGHGWVGVPLRGSRERQPGGWVYNSLPYLELGNLHQMGSLRTAIDARESYSRRLSTPLCLFTCPSRRACTTWTVSDRWEYLSHPKPAGVVTKVARGDYAINGGASHVFSWPGPENFLEGDSASFYWPYNRNFSGISHLKIGVLSNDVEDGLSHTYLVGEKFLDPNHYADGESLGDNETLYSGFATDLHRFTQPDLLPLQDTSSEHVLRKHSRFGSAHSAGCYFAFCDGSVRTISYDIDRQTHCRNGHREDQGSSDECRENAIPGIPQ